MNVYKTVTKILVLLLVVSSIVHAQKADPIYNALQDEMARSLEKLQMEDLEKPYFISCGVSEWQSVRIEGALGALVNSDSKHSRELYVDLRVGDYSLDNSNYGMDMFGGISIGMGPMGGGRSSSLKLTLDQDYDILRHQIWYYIDQEYKDALEDYAGKQAALSTPEELEDYSGDLTKEEKVEYFEPPVQWDIDKSTWEETIREVSTVFKKYPHIMDSGVKFDANYSRNYILNTEGTNIISNEISYSILINATMQDEEGNQKSDNKSYFARNLSELPTRQELIAAAEEIVSSLKVIMEGDTVGYYVGPVLFEEEASTHLFTSLLAKKIIAIDLPVVEKSQQMFMKPLMQQLGIGSSIGKKATATFISVFDDPSLTEYNGVTLAGHYDYDMEGVKAQRVELIDKGILNQVLNHRRPSKKQPQSNGHGRIGTPGSSAMSSMSNLFIKSGESAATDEVRKQFMDLCKENGLEYGIIIRKFYTPTSEKEIMKTIFSSAMSMSGGGKLSMPMEPLSVYKIDVESGMETLVKNIAFDNLDEGALKDIVITSDTEYVNNSGGTSPEASIGVSVIAPELVLIEELALSRKSASSEEKPLIPNPNFPKD